MKKKIRTIKTLLSLILLAGLMTSCLTRKEIRYMQPNENLALNENGYIPYNIPEYRVNRNDLLRVNVITTPKGDAAQFYSNLIARSSTGTGGSSGTSGFSTNDFYFNGLRLDERGDINIFGMGFIHAEGRTLAEIEADVQNKVNENFLPEKTEVRVSLEGIKYYILNDLGGKSVAQTARVNTLTVLEMLAENGGLDGKVDRKNIRVYRKFPEGVKLAVIDVTREDLINSPYFYVQNGDMYLLNTKTKSLNGFGNDPLRTLSTGVGLLSTAISLYLIFDRIKK